MERIEELRAAGYGTQEVNGVWWWHHSKSGASQADAGARQPYRSSEGQAWRDCDQYVQCCVPHTAAEAEQDWSQVDQFEVTPQLVERIRAGRLDSAQDRVVVRAGTSLLAKRIISIEKSATGVLNIRLATPGGEVIPRQAGAEIDILKRR